MIRPQHLARAAAFALLAATLPAAADYPKDYADDYANNWLGDRLRRDNPERAWSDLVARPARPAEYPSSGPRTWDARDENPWANTYGKPMSNRWRAPAVQPRSPSIVRICSCYLPADARSWDGGPLTVADITRLCRAQCS